MHFSKTWTWNNPHSGKTSHSMTVSFDLKAKIVDEENGGTVNVNITNISMGGANGQEPDPGTTQDHMVLASTNTLPPQSPAPSRPISLPYPSNLSSLGGFAELATHLNRGNPQRYSWGGSSASYSLPYTGSDMVLVYAWASFFKGQDIAWTIDGFNVKLGDLRYIPMEGKTPSGYKPFNDYMLEGKNGGYQTIWNYFGSDSKSTGQGKTNNQYKRLEKE